MLNLLNYQKQSIWIWILFFVGLFKGTTIFCYCVFHLSILLLSKFKKDGIFEERKCDEVLEKNDFCEATESMILFNKDISIEEEKILEEENNDKYFNF